MRSILSIVMLVCLVSAINIQLSHSSSSEQESDLKLKELIEKGFEELEDLPDIQSDGTDVASSRKLGLGLKVKGLFLKPLALAKIKIALLLGKPLVLTTLKKLLLKAFLGKLLLKIPLILLGTGKAGLLAKVVALKFALIKKGLFGLKAPLALLFLGGLIKVALKGTGLGLALGLAGSLLKPNGQSGEEYDEPTKGYAPPKIPPPPPPTYNPPTVYSAPVYSAPVVYSSVPLYMPTPYFQTSSSVGGSNYGSGRRKRNLQENSDSGEEFFSEESAEELRLEIEAAEINGHAYLYMAAQFDEQSCGRRLFCEVYQKPKGNLTEDEKLLQNNFGYPLPSLNDEDQGTPKEMYYRAAQLGANHQGQPNNQICARFYATCPHNAEQLIHFFVSEDVETNEIESDHNRPVSHLKPPKQSVGRLPFYQPNNFSPAQRSDPIVFEPAVDQNQTYSTTPIQDQVVVATATHLRQSNITVSDV